MRRLAVLVALALGACGDNVVVEVHEEARSGTRLKLEWHLYEDTTRQLATDAFYDVRLHARCTPRPWGDGAIRCVPEAGDTLYTDAACTVEIGRARLRRPAFFVGHDELDGARIGARLLRAGSKLDTPAEGYELRAGACVAVAIDPDAQYHALGGPADAVELIAGELGEGRLGLRVWTSADGLWAPRALVDRDLDAPCDPDGRPDGAACVPRDAVAATVFADAACTLPAVTAATAPAIAWTGVDGCATYHHVEPTPRADAYHVREGACVRLPGAAPVFAVGAPLALAAVERTREDVPGRRLQRIVVTAGDLRTYDARLFDTATRAECDRHALAYGSRCLPARAPAARRVAGNARCGFDVAIAEVAPMACAPGAFAIAVTDDGPAVHVIGDAYAGDLFARGEADACTPYAPPLGLVPHALGPAVPLDAFVGAIPFGER